MILIAAVIALSTALGLGAERRYGERAENASRGLMTSMLWVLLPIVTFFNVAALEPTARVGIGIGFAYVALAVTLSLAYLVGSRLLRLPRTGTGALMVAAGFANTGYLGLPFSAALFGTESLPTAIAYDISVSGLALVTVGFSVGAAFGSVGSRARDRARGFLTRNPPLWAAAAGAIAPAALAPQWAVDGSRVIVFALLPLGFLVVGITLAREAEDGALGFPPRLGSGVLAALGLRLLVAPAVVLALSLAVLRVPDTYLSQAAMASGINGILIAHEYGLDRSLVAGAIAWSTSFVVIAGLVAELV